MANTYQQSIIATAQGQPSRVFFNPLLAQGRTMGAVVYSGLQAEHNAALVPGAIPVGIMIVTRLKAQADEVASGINAYVGRQVAIADHTDHRATPEQLDVSDIVVITHAANPLGCPCRSVATPYALARWKTPSYNR